MASNWAQTLPLGTYVGQDVDPNSTPFLKSIGYTDEIATKYGSHPSTMTFSRTGENDYILNISQSAINRSQDIPFQLDLEKTTNLPGGRWMKSLFQWDAASNAMRCTYSNSENQKWHINYFFDDSSVKMIRDSDTVHTEQVFQKQ